MISTPLGCPVEPDVFFQELRYFYGTPGEDAPPALPLLAVQYADYALWEQEWLQGPEPAAQLAYWQQRLAALPPAMPLPTDRPRPPVPTFRGAVHEFTLPAFLRTKLRAFSREEGATLYMTLLAGFAALLTRVGGQADLVIGTPVAGRNEADLHPLIGFFVNTLALRLDLSANPSFRDLLAQTRSILLDGAAHQDVPFAQVVEAVHPNRSLSQSPIISLMFALETSEATTLKLGDSLGQPLNLDTGTTKFDLTLVVADDANGLHIHIEYNADLFDLTTPWWLGSYYQTLLEAALAAPDTRIQQIPLLTPVERRLVLEGWNNTQMPYLTAPAVHQLITLQTRKKPEALAVVGPDATLTYGELNRRANQLARHLRTLGVGPEVPVGVFMERTAAMVVGLLAILKAGGAYVPFDPAYPPGRLAFMFEDAQVPVVLTQESLRARLPATAPHVLALDAAQRPWALAPAEELPPLDDPGNLAYVIYTSGSTGRPKGVAISHAGLLNLIYWHHETFEVVRSSRASHVAGLGFDAAVWELWPYLAAGAAVHLVPEAVRLDPARFRAWVQAEGITHSFLPTPLAEQLLTLNWPTGSALRWLLTGGDRLHRGPSPDAGYELVNAYGPTENTVVSSTAMIPPAEEDAGLPPIGRPVANTVIYLLDPSGQPVPVSVPGEVYIGGAGLARGYLNRPDLTAERFVPNPFSRTPGARLYRTGDLARWQADGTLEFLGRRDYQVKIRGFRIELGEVEWALRDHPAVAEAAVLTRQDRPGDAQLVAYIVPTAPDAVDAPTLRTALREKLPDYMVPAAFVFLPALPLTANGKVDRAALPAPIWQEQETYAAPHEALERALVAIWQAVLGGPPVGIDDNFFDRGGHSLLMVQVQTRIQETLHRDLSIIDLFVYPTIRSLAAHLRREGGPPVPDAPAAAPRPPDQRRAAFSQQRQVRRAQHLPT